MLPLIALAVLHLTAHPAAADLLRPALAAVNHLRRHLPTKGCAGGTMAPSMAVGRIAGDLILARDEATAD
jgi:hypothetical protein